MVYIFYYLVALTVFCNVMCLGYALLIAHSRVADTVTWAIFALGFAGRLVQTLWGLMRLTERFAYYIQFGSVFLMESMLLETVIYLLFLVAMSRKYHSIKTRL